MGLLVGDGTITEVRRASCPSGRVRPSATATSASAVRTPSWPRRSMPRVAATITSEFLRLARSRPPRRVPPRRGRHHRAGARSRTAPGPPDHHAGHRARLERVLSRLPARTVRLRGQRAGHAGQGRVDPPRPLRPRMLEGVQRMLLRLGIATTIYRNRAQHEPGHHRRKRGAFRRAHRFRRHGQALAAGRACWATTSAR